MTVTIDGKSMVAQEHVDLVRSLFDLWNDHQSGPEWREKYLAAFAADAEIIDVPSGATLHGPDGYKRFVLFFAEALPDSRVELTKVFATEDEVTLECTVRWNDTGSLPLPWGALQSMRCSGELRYCLVLEFRKGKIVSLHSYYDMLTQLEQRGLVPAWRQTTQ